MKAETRDKVLIGIGIFGLLGFLYLYAVKLFGQHGKPLTSALVRNLKHTGGKHLVFSHDSTSAYNLPTLT